VSLSDLLLILALPPLPIPPIAVSDLAIGAANADDPASRGSVYFLYLRQSSTSPGLSCQVLTGTFTSTLSNGDWFGTSVALIDDVNKDGVSGEQGWRPGESSRTQIPRSCLVEPRGASAL
jgi:hypothetical protein